MQKMKNSEIQFYRAETLKEQSVKGNADNEKLRGRRH